MRVTAAGAQTGSRFSTSPSSTCHNGVTFSVLPFAEFGCGQLVPHTHAIDVGGDQHLRERREIRVVLTRTGSDRNLHVGFAGLHELHQIGESRLLHAERLVGVTVVVENDRHRRCGQRIFHRGNDRQCRIELDVPVAALHALGGSEKTLARDVGIVDAGSGQIEPDALETQFGEPVELGIRCLVVDDRDAARILAARLHAEDRRRIIGAVDARRDDHDALHVQRLVQRRHFLRQRHLGRVGAAGKPRVFGGIAVDMRMTIARARRHVEIHRCRRLRSFRKTETGMQQSARRRGAEHELTSGNHAVPPLVVSNYCSICIRYARTLRMATMLSINATPVADAPPGPPAPGSSAWENLSTNRILSPLAHQRPPAARANYRRASSCNCLASASGTLMPSFAARAASSTRRAPGKRTPSSSSIASMSVSMRSR